MQNLTIQVHFNHDEMEAIYHDLHTSPDHRRIFQRCLMDKIMELRNIKGYRYDADLLRLGVNEILPFTTVFVRNATNPLLKLEVINIADITEMTRPFKHLIQSQQDRELIKMFEREAIQNYRIPSSSVPMITYSNTIMKLGRIRVNSFRCLENIELHYE
jgi:hypothetical protein